MTGQQYIETNTNVVQRPDSPSVEASWNPDESTQYTMSPGRGVGAIRDDDSNHMDSICESAPVTSSGNVGARPLTLDKMNPALKMSTVSRQYDRSGKGYLDKTEEMMRRMDSQNQGFLDNEKVYGIVRSLQDEQKKTSDLIMSLQKEQQKSMSLRRGLFYMGGFALLLAIANIGTSFAASSLAKDTSVKGYDLIVKDGNGARVATTSKNIILNLHPVEETSSRRRQLQETVNSICQAQMDASGDSSMICEAVGVVSYQDALNIYQAFCPEFPGVTDVSGCSNLGLNEVLLTCGGRITKILGGIYFPAGGLPASLGEFVVFPTPASGNTASLVASAYMFHARQLVVEPPAQFSLTAVPPLQECEERINLKLYCNPATENNCMLIHTYHEISRRCQGEVRMCGAPGGGNNIARRLGQPQP